MRTALNLIRCRLHGLRQQNEPLLHPGAASVRQQGQLRGRRVIASAQGNYAGFYAEFAHAARRSAQEKVVIAL